MLSWQSSPLDVNRDGMTKTQESMSIGPGSESLYEDAHECIFSRSVLN